MGIEQLPQGEDIKKEQAKAPSTDWPIDLAPGFQYFLKEEKAGADANLEGQDEVLVEKDDTKATSTNWPIDPAPGSQFFQK